MRWLACCGGALVALLIGACDSQPVSAQVPAFPGAEGAGATSLGGRGGRVIRVTNLYDSGPGSLRAAIEARAPRTIVFDVGGTISLKTPLTIRNGRVTIAGQTAPGGGITLRDQTFGIHADDVVVRFIRSRLGDVSRVTNDAIWVSTGNRIILDHVSASWGTDESLSVTSGNHPGQELGDVTVQWSMISESLCNSVNPKGRHCFGSIIGASRGARISFHHNLWADHTERMPRVGTPLTAAEDSTGGFIDIRSNVIYNWGGHQGGYSGAPFGRVSYNFVDNSYWSGPDSHGSSIFKEGNPLARAYFSGNSLNGNVLPTGLSGVTGMTNAGYLLPEALRMPPVTTDSAAAAYDKVLRSAGDSLVRDAVDSRVITGVRNRTGHLIDSERDVGGWPELAPGAPRVDSDGDGIPDDWERAHGLNPRDSGDGARVNGDGYTNLEHWLNELAAPAMPR